MTNSILKATGISKSYAGTQALLGVDFHIEAGEVVGLIGENGAGKSTLMKILCGLESFDEGRVELHGDAVRFESPQEAQAAGVAMIPQEVLLVDALTVTENMFLGHELKSAWGGLQKQAMKDRTRAVLAQLGCAHVDPDQHTGFLPKGSQQLVAIARRLIQGGEVFVLDEPTASLTTSEVERFFEVVKRLKENGKPSVFISHRLEEMLEICDRIVVLRDGKLVGNFPNDGTLDKERLVQAMVGTNVVDEFSRDVSGKGHVLIETEGISVMTFQGRRTPPISLKAHSGQVIGITGLAGVGKTELAQALAGLRSVQSGQLKLRGQPVILNSPVDARRHKIGMVSEDRRNEGLVLQMAALSNMTFTCLSALSRFLRIDRLAESQLGHSMLDRLLMKPEFLGREANLLSGGNQQKVVIIRQICGEAELLLLDEPTKGIDIGAKAEVSRLIGQLVKEGKSAILFSSEPREILGLCDEIHILTADAHLGPFPRDKLDYASLMALQFGTHNEAAPSEATA